MCFSFSDTRKWTQHDNLKGRNPAGRSYHAAVMIGNRMAVMGGRSQSESHFADMHILDLGKLLYFPSNFLLKFY